MGGGAMIHHDAESPPARCRRVHGVNVASFRSHAVQWYENLCVFLRDADI